MSFLAKIVRNVARFRYQNHKYVFSLSAQISHRNFNCNSKMFNKIYMEYENKYAYDIMRNKGFAVDIETNNMQGCNTTLVKEQFEKLLQEDWSKKSPAQIFEAFPKLAAYSKENNLCISNTIFDSYIDNLTDNLNRATDEELVSIFYALNQWPETKSIRTRNYIEIWVALDDVCFSRLNNWSFDEMLSFISLFYMLNVTKASHFSKKSLDKLAAKAKRLTLSQFVQTLFFVGIQRRSPYDMHNLEVHLENNFSQFSVDDLAILSMGFFKSKTPIRSFSLVLKMMGMVMENSKNIHEVSLAALLKVVRYSMKIPLEDGTSMIYKLLDVLQNEVPRLSVMCNVHIALLGTSNLVLHKSCLDCIADFTINNMSLTRIKDLERLVLSYGTFRYTPQTKEDFFENIMEELRKPERAKEIQNHGRSFACCVQYFGLLGLYPVDLIDKVLNPLFLETTYGKQCYGYGKEILFINNSVEIFCDEQKINRLSEKEVKILSKKYTEYMPRENFQKQYNITEKMVLDVMKILREILGGSEFVVGDHILTHHRRGDIILCKTPEGTPVPISVEQFHPSTFGLIRTPPDNNTWIVLVIVGRNSIIHNIQTPTGQFHVKIEELQKLGYHANLVLWNVYANLDTLKKKEEYLWKCINEAVNKKI